MIIVTNVYKSFKNHALNNKAGFGQLLSKNFVSRSNKEVLKGISFVAEPGKIYGLLGPNGAGKTTTLRCIATLLKPDTGTIQVGNYSVANNTDIRAIRAKVGFLTSDMKLSGNLTPRELLLFFGRLNQLNESKIALRTGQLGTYLNMSEFLDTRIDRCSTGQKQKTAIAVSLVHDPDIIIFDEPSNGLDILAAKTVMDFLCDYRNQGKTVILSTHIMAEAESLCDRIGIVLDGRIVAEGSKEELMDRFKEPDLSSVFFGIAKARGYLNGK